MPSLMNHGLLAPSF